MERLTRDGASLSYEDVGKGAPPILLIHDLGCDHTSLQPHIEHFRGRHRVVAVDLPGHDHSDSLSQVYTLASFADALAWLCYELGVYRPVAVGHGIGGMIALEIAGRYPDLIAAVVVLDTPTLSPTDARARIQEVEAQLGEAANSEAVCRVDALVVPATNDSGKVGLVEATAPKPYLAETQESAVRWDEAVAMAHYNVPVLYVKTETSHTDIDSLRASCRRIVIESIPINHGDQREAAKKVNALIDAFLRVSSAGVCTPARGKSQGTTP